MTSAIAIARAVGVMGFLAAAGLALLGIQVLVDEIRFPIDWKSAAVCVFGEFLLASLCAIIGIAMFSL